MSFCYLLMCHTDPDAILRLVRRIRELSPHSEVLVRYENPALVDPLDVEAAGGRPFLSRARVSWGDFSLVEGELEALAVARALTQCDYVTVISGQDYPVRDLADWEAEIRERRVDALFDPLQDQPDDHRWRWTVLTPPAGLRHDHSPGRRAVVRAGSLWSDRATVLVKPDEPRLWFGLRRHRESPPVRPVKCAQWAVYHRRAIDSILLQDHARPELRTFFRTVRTPDEWYGPSLVCADPALRVGIGTTTGKFFPEGSPNPVWVDEEVLSLLQRRYPAPFVRKVHPNGAPTVLDQADAMATRTRAEVYADVTEPALRTAAWAHEVRATVVHFDPVGDE